jgi:hypothetical protein
MVIQIDNDRSKYVESDKPSSEHKFGGWYYHYADQKYYRFDDLPCHEDK